MIKDERGQWLLSAEHQQQNNEYAISGLVQDKVISIKIDHTFVDKDGTRWIIDYKTSRHEGSDIESFLDQQHDSMDGVGRNAPGAAFEERYREQAGEIWCLNEIARKRSN